MAGFNLYKANLTKTKIANVNFEGTVFCKTVMPSGEDNSGCKN
ncbi:MAG: hypothetical protein F3741_11645 [Nitrospinae bacterium]|nr:hypothetical protein [Nitrospinota bacterium]